MWNAKTRNGQEINEKNSQWSTISKDVCELSLINKNNQTISLPSNMPEYIQFKSASANMVGGNVEIESRVIGFTFNNMIVCVRLDEKTNNISIEVGKR